VVVYQDLLLLAPVVVVVTPRSGLVSNHPGCTRAQFVAHCPMRGIWYTELRYPMSNHSPLIP
jgi:hypothetical protein